MAATVHPVLSGSIEEDVLFHTQQQVIRQRHLSESGRLKSGVGEISFTPVPILIDGKPGKALLKTFIDGVSLKDLIVGRNPEFSRAEVREALSKARRAMDGP